MRVLVFPGDWLRAKGLEVALSDGGYPVVLEPLPYLEELSRCLEQDEAVVFMVCGDGQLLVEVAHELDQACRRVRAIASVPVDTPVMSLVWWARRGYSLLLDTADPEMLRLAVRAVAAEGCFVDPGVAARLLSGVEDESWGAKALRRIDPEGVLPTHTWGVALLIGLGLHDEEIAEYLGRTRSTVEGYRHEVYRASGISGHRELMHRVQGCPPCGGTAARCVRQGAAMQALSRHDIPSCPHFPVCVAALRNY